MLADRCWTNPPTYIHEWLPKMAIDAMEALLLAAILIHLLTFLVPPLLQTFLSEVTDQEIWQARIYE